MSKIVMTLSREERETYLACFSELDAQFTGKVIRNVMARARDTFLLVATILLTDFVQIIG